MKHWDWRYWSNLVWIALALVVIAFELMGVWRVGPWRTLSETIWVDEQHFHVLYLLIGGFLSGLGMHFSPNRLDFWESMGGGLLLVTALYLIALAWPK